MKLLIFSDTHLTNHFEPKEFTLLKRIISQADKVVINGDFWDGYYISFEQFLSSKWRELFPLLKERHTVYVVGNHDKMSLINEKALVFCDEYCESKKLIWGNTKLHIEHGNRFSLGIVERYPWILNNLTRLGNKVKKFILMRLFKENTFKLSSKAKTTNRKILQWTKQNLPEDELFIAGHSHLPSDNFKQGSINVGQIDEGVASYLTIEADGKTVEFTLHEEKY